MPDTMTKHELPPRFKDISEIKNPETLAALKEGDEMLAHPERYKWWTDVRAMHRAILAEPDDDDDNNA